MARARVSYVDWMRGFAVLLMMQTHAYDSWLSPQARAGEFHGWSRLLGGYPAPLFLFLAGLGLALLAELRLGHGTDAPVLRRELARRSLQVLLYALLFRLWMFASSGFVRATALARVDVLNCIGLSMLLVGVLALPARAPAVRLGLSVSLGAAIALLTPLAWDSAWPAWIPDAVKGYWTGRAHGAYFPLFPWAGFTAAGAAAGTLLASARRAGTEGRSILGLALGGALAIPLALLLRRLPSVYPVDDFWWTSPSYFVLKLGVVLVVLGLAYAWNRSPWRAWPSPLRLLGRASLLVYWVHIEIVYGGIVAPMLRHRLSVLEASAGLATLTAAMLGLAFARTRIRQRAPVTAGVPAQG
jgi:uncharacterized membrane protein